jgi:drug/metabolite transporter (DMT)-like permease
MSAPALDVQPRRDADTQGLVFGFIGVLIFSFSMPFTRIAVRDLDPTFVGLGRALVAAALSGGLLFITRQRIPTRAQFVRIGVTALGVVIGFPLFSAWATRYVEASHASIVNALAPLATATFAVLVSGDRPSARFWLAAIIGSGTVIAFILFQSGVAVGIGDLAMLAAVAFVAMGYVAGGRLSGEIGSWQTICWANVISVPFLIWPVWSAAPAQLADVSTASWVAFGYVSVFSMFLGFIAWYRGLALGGIPRVSQVQLIQAFLSITWSGLLLGEHITPLMLVAAGVVVAMIAVARSATISKRSRAAD